LRTSTPPSGTRAIRRRAAFSSMPGRACSRAMISGCSYSSTPKAAATASAVMSSCVGPIPPVVKT
jgi:hypothetical protein